MTIRSMEKCGEQSKSTSNHRVETQSVHICLKKIRSRGKSTVHKIYVYVYVYFIEMGFQYKDQAGLKDRGLIASASECWD